MSKVIRLLFIFPFLAVSSQATALPITFDFRSPAIEDIDGMNTLSISKKGLSIFLETSNGVFNRTNSSFGINATGSGDEPDEIDSGEGVESLMIRFDQTIRLFSLKTSLLGSEDSGGLMVGTTILLNFSTSGIHDLSNTLLKTGESLNLGFVNGNGFSFDALSVNVAEVDEPYPLFLITTGLVLITRRLYGLR